MYTQFITASNERFKFYFNNLKVGDALKTITFNAGWFNFISLDLLLKHIKETDTRFLSHVKRSQE